MTDVDSQIEVVSVESVDLRKKIYEALESPKDGTQKYTKMF